MPDEKRWTTFHGTDELRDKFTVIQNKTGYELTASEFIFTLRPETDPAAVAALLYYCHLTDGEYPVRNHYVREELNRILKRELADANP